MAFQDRMPGNHCFGCGAENEEGLRIKSFWAGERESTCRFRPEPHQAAGPPGFLNGGIIATLIDCHGVCTAIADAYRREGRGMGEGELIWYVTGSLQVDYRRPTPIENEVEAWARITESAGRKTWLDCALRSNGELRAEARLLAVRVDPAGLQHDGVRAPGPT
ncbi:MAG: PaaI family thioesterase [Thermoanaerobaculia bacterium]